MSATAPLVVRVTRRFEAAAERVFDAFLDPARARHFLFATPGGEMVRADIDPRVGGAFTFIDRRDGEDIEHVGTYLEIDRPRRLVFTFGVPRYDPRMTRVTIEIAPAGAGCTLTLIHENVPSEWAEQTQAGWTKILDGLAKTVE
jgi:uncharacterized protein YndB with AHSA1/START domain